MKKIIATILSIMLIILTLAGCGNEREILNALENAGVGIGNNVAKHEIVTTAPLGEKIKGLDDGNNVLVLSRSKLKEVMAGEKEHVYLFNYVNTTTGAIKEVDCDLGLDFIWMGLSQYGDREEAVRKEFVEAMGKYTKSKKDATWSIEGESESEKKSNNEFISQITGKNGFLDTETYRQFFREFYNNKNVIFEDGSASPIDLNIANYEPIFED